MATVTTGDVASAASIVFDIPLAELRGQSRKRAIARPRQLCYLIAYEVAHCASFPKIGLYFGRDHTTVLHGMREARKYLDAGIWQKEYDLIKEAVGKIAEQRLEQKKNMLNQHVARRPPARY